MRVRSLVHRLGYRFRLHRRDLPGRPDLVLPRLGKAILVHGCYWHVHRCRYGRVVPRTNAEFWQQKRQATVSRATAATCAACVTPSAPALSPCRRSPIRSIIGPMSASCTTSIQCRAHRSL